MIWLLACVTQDPTAVALKTCRAMPGVHVDGAGQALMSDAVVPEELALWRSDAPDYGPVITDIGLTGYGVVRSNCSCQFLRWEGEQAVLLRREPDLTPLLGRWKEERVWEQPVLEQELRLDIEDSDAGPRARLGLEAFREEAFAARRMADAGDFEAAIAALDALHERFPDPMLVLEKELVAERQELAARPPIEVLGEEDLPTGEDEAPTEPEQP